MTSSTIPLPAQPAAPDLAELPDLPDLPELRGFARPRWRDDVPIMWRQQSVVQFGDDVVVDRVTRGHVTWLRSIDGMRTPQQIAADLTIPAVDARRLIRAALAAAAFEDAARICDAVRWAPQPERDVQAGRFGAALRTYRRLDAAFGAMAAREACRVHVLGSGILAAEVTAALGAAGLAASDPRHATATVLADALHPDVPAHFDHATQDRPHVHVGVLGERAVIGPMVVPGRTSCLRCAHLHRRDADAGWPLVAVQWAQAVPAMSAPPVDPLLVRLAATQVCVLLRAWVDAPDDPTAWSEVAFDVRLPGGAMAAVGRPAHPLCGCRWPQE